MNDLSIQGSRAYAAAYTSNEVKVQATASTEAAKSPTAVAGDTVFISSQARELFQQSSINDTSVVPTNSDQSGAASSTAESSINPGVSSGSKPGQVTLMNGGGGVRPPESP